MMLILPQIQGSGVCTLDPCSSHWEFIQNVESQIPDQTS